MSHGSSSPIGGSDVDVDMDTETLTNGSRSVGSATPRPELINENAPINIMPTLGHRLEPSLERYDVCIVGAGPAGLMLGYGTLTDDDTYTVYSPPLTHPINLITQPISDPPIPSHLLTPHDSAFYLPAWA